MSVPHSGTSQKRLPPRIELLLPLPMPIFSASNTMHCLPKEKTSCVPSPTVDRGWSWVILCSACVIHFMVFGLHYSYGVIFPKLLDEFQEGEGRTAWIGSIASGFLLFSSFFAVKLTEATSVSFTCVLGSLLAGSGLIMTSFIRRFILLYVSHSVLFGIGSSLLYTPSLIVIATSFEKWRSLTTGIVVAFGSLGQLVMAYLLQICLDNFGVRTTFRYGGLIFVVLSFSCSLTLVSSVTLATQEKSDRLLSSGLMRNKAYVVWLVVMIITNFTYYIPLTYLVSYAKRVGASPTQGSYLLMFLAIASMTGRVMFGKFVNARPMWTVRIYQVALFASGVCSLAASFANYYWQLIAYVLLYGLLDGSFIGIMSLVTLKIVGLRNLANGWGFMLCCIGLPVALGPATVGWMNDNGILDQRSMFYLSGFPMVAGSLAMFYVCRQVDQRPSADSETIYWSDLIQISHIADKECLIQKVSVV